MIANDQLPNNRPGTRPTHAQSPRRGMSRWNVRANGTIGGMVSDAEEVRRALTLFTDPENGCELRAIPTGVHRTLPGSDIDGLCRAADEMPGGIGVYFIINPVPIGLHKAAANGDVVKRRWLYIDIDPKKPEEHTDNPATDDEKNRTGLVCDNLNEYLRERNWPAPVITDSGNGFGMFYRCEFSNEKLVQQTYSSVLKVLAAKFNGTNGTIDLSIHNAARLAKLPGTWAKKGRQSDDRPHRPCKLLYVPETVEAVTWEAFSAIAVTTEKPPQAERPQAKSTDTKAKSREEAYGRRALDAECARVALSRPPADGGEGRNNALNRAAFCLGQLVAGKVLPRDLVESRLREAARHCGLEEREINQTIRSGLDAGIKTPRGVPEQPEDPKVSWRKDAGHSEPPADGEPLTVRLSAVKPAMVDWLIRNRIPKRFITVFAGRTGVGKSFVSHDLIARISTGGEIPFGGGECFTPGGTLIISEDSHEFVLAPRLMEAGANCDRVNAMTWKAMSGYHLSNTDMLTRACDEIEGGCSLVMIDPPTNFLADTDEHKNSEIRQLVMKVVEWALERDLAVLFILHVNKQSGKGVEALNRVMGSVAWVTTSRIAHTFCPDPDDSTRCLWVPLKNNLGPITKALAYRIAPSGSAARVEWIEEVDVSADEALGHAEPRKRSVEASVWLAELFAEMDSIPSKTVWKRMGAETTISKNAVLEAKEEMGIKAQLVYDETGNKSWHWTWPKDARDGWAKSGGGSENGADEGENP